MPYSNPEDTLAWRKRYYQANKEKIKAETKKYYYDNREACCAQALIYRSTRKEEINKYAAEYRETHKQEIKASQKKWREKNREYRAEAHREWREQNAEYVKEKSAEYAATHREVFAVARNKRKARIVGNGGSYTVEQWFALKEFYDNRCICCGDSEKYLLETNRTLAADHVVALAMGGTSNIDNIQPLCHGMNGCNNKKGIKHLDFRTSYIPEEQKVCDTIPEVTAPSISMECENVLQETQWQ